MKSASTGSTVTVRVCPTVTVVMASGYEMPSALSNIVSGMFSVPVRITCHWIVCAAAGVLMCV